MKKLLLATVATAALSFPAFAQNATQPMQKPTQQMNSGATGAAANHRQAMNQLQQPIRASQLSKQQIRQIQLKLNKQGFDTGHADGVWGHDTDVALKNFQKKQSLPGNGHLNRQTLQALGVNVSGQASEQNRQVSPRQQRQGAATTGQGSSANRGMHRQPNTPNSMSGPQSSEPNGNAPSQQ